MTRLAISFTNFGPYHLARLRALATRLNQDGGHLIAYETAGNERRYPWQIDPAEEPFTWVTLFPGQTVEDLSRKACARAIRQALARDRPNAVAICGYARPESLAALTWAGSCRRPAILMSETQAIDHPRVWWKEAIKRRRVRRFAAALVGGPRHRDYLVHLGMPANRIVLGYNAVDHDAFARRAEALRADPTARAGLPEAPYFIAVSRFVPEKNLTALVRAFSTYRRATTSAPRWDLVLCGGGPAEAEVEAAVAGSRHSSSIHRPGFLQTEELTRWLTFASGFVHPSLMEPWGLVVNEAAACGLPLLVSERAGCAETLVPMPPGTTGRRFNPLDREEIGWCLDWLASLPEDKRLAMGRRAAEVASHWGPDSFAEGLLDALARARGSAVKGSSRNLLWRAASC
jgi:glycosyltransferase involved in cell wall biosynthesis